MLRTLGSWRGWFVLSSAVVTCFEMTGLRDLSSSRHIERDASVSIVCHTAAVVETHSPGPAARRFQGDGLTLPLLLLPLL